MLRKELERIKPSPHLGTEEELQRKIRNAYYRFKLSDNCTSLLKEVLNHEVYHAYKDKKTKFGGSFWDVIQAGAQYIDEPIGLFAPDPEAYTVFKPLFNVAIDEIHLGFSHKDKQPQHSWGDPKVNIRNPDPLNKYIESTRIRLCRNLVGYPFASCLTRSLLKEIEGKITPVLKDMPWGLDGRYFPLEKLRDEIQNELRNEHVLWHMPNKYMKSTNVGRFWPTGRGVFMNKLRTFLVWVGKDDHMRIISTRKGSKILDVYQLLIRGTDFLEEHLDFVHDDRLGYLTFDPANLGTTLRASYLIRLPRLSEAKLVEPLAENFGLEVRGTYGLKRPVKKGLYNISNRRRLGLTEFEAVMSFQLGISNLIMEEEKLENAIKNDVLERLSLEKEMSAASTRTKIAPKTHVRFDKSPSTGASTSSGPSSSAFTFASAGTSSSASTSASVDVTSEKKKGKLKPRNKPLEILVDEADSELIMREIECYSTAIESPSTAASQKRASSHSRSIKNSISEKKRRRKAEIIISSVRTVNSSSSSAASSTSISGKSIQKKHSSTKSTDSFTSESINQESGDIYIGSVSISLDTSSKTKRKKKGVTSPDDKSISSRDSRITLHSKDTSSISTASSSSKSSNMKRKRSFSEENQGNVAAKERFCISTDAILDRKIKGKMSSMVGEHNVSGILSKHSVEEDSSVSSTSSKTSYVTLENLKHSRVSFRDPIEDNLTSSEDFTLVISNDAALRKSKLKHKDHKTRDISLPPETSKEV